MLIYHVDVNSAYLSWIAVSLLENGYETDIREIPSAIAGDPENRHGIILAKSISAKKYGIKTGESLMEARKKCPNLKVYAPDYDLFLSCSDAMYEILLSYTPVIQRYSVDECFCDMSRSPEVRKNPVKLAYEIKERIKRELGFTVNIGIGENKLCAKMAGELEKPDMIHTLWPSEIADKLWPLPAGELFMVGRATEKKLKRFGIESIGDIAAADTVFLKSLLKSHGQLIYEYANGIDTAPLVVNEDVIQRGIGNSMTFSYDLEEKTELYQEALALCERVGMRLRRIKRRASLVSIHIRNNRLFRYSHQVQLQTYFKSTIELYEIVKSLIDEVWKGEPVRQMGIAVSGFASDDEVQMSFFDNAEREVDEKLDEAVDMLRDRYGNECIVRGSFVNTNIKPIEGGVNDGNYLMMGGYKL